MKDKKVLIILGCSVLIVCFILSCIISSFILLISIRQYSFNDQSESTSGYNVIETDEYAFYYPEESKEVMFDEKESIYDYVKLFRQSSNGGKPAGTISLSYIQDDAGVNKAEPYTINEKECFDLSTTLNKGEIPTEIKPIKEASYFGCYAMFDLAYSREKQEELYISSYPNSKSFNKFFVVTTRYATDGSSVAQSKFSEALKLFKLKENSDQPLISERPNAISNMDKKFLVRNQDLCSSLDLNVLESELGITVNSQKSTFFPQQLTINTPGGSFTVPDKLIAFTCTIETSKKETISIEMYYQDDNTYKAFRLWDMKFKGLKESEDVTLVNGYGLQAFNGKKNHGILLRYSYLTLKSSQDVDSEKALNILKGLLND